MNILPWSFQNCTLHGRRIIMRKNFFFVGRISSNFLKIERHFVGFLAKIVRQGCRKCIVRMPWHIGRKRSPFERLEFSHSFLVLGEKSSATWWTVLAAFLHGYRNFLKKKIFFSTKLFSIFFSQRKTFQPFGGRILAWLPKPPSMCLG